MVEYASDSEDNPVSSKRKKKEALGGAVSLSSEEVDINEEERPASVASSPERAKRRGRSRSPRTRPPWRKPVTLCPAKTVGSRGGSGNSPGREISVLYSRYKLMAAAQKSSLDRSRPALSDQEEDDCQTRWARPQSPPEDLTYTDKRCPGSDEEHTKEGDNTTREGRPQYRATYFRHGTERPAHSSGHQQDSLPVPQASAGHSQAARRQPSSPVRVSSE